MLPSSPGKTEFPALSCIKLTLKTKFEVDFNDAIPFTFIELNALVDIKMVKSVELVPIPANTVESNRLTPPPNFNVNVDCTDISLNFKDEKKSDSLNLRKIVRRFISNV
mmetsp:Transcript_16967/g.16319  ORF Transcript_16967/g.16319 Transcript_16967/m.16319 type:complete len:109 (-) Transcript_16967:1532-1858(-)